MALKPIAKRTIACPLGTCHEGQWCLDVVQVALATDGKEALPVKATPIVVGNMGEGEELLAHPPRIALQ